MQNFDAKVHHTADKSTTPRTTDDTDNVTTRLGDKKSDSLLFFKFYQEDALDSSCVERSSLGSRV